MEMLCTAVRPAALRFVACVMVASLATVSMAQNPGSNQQQMVAASATAAQRTIKQPLESMELLVKSSTILKLENPIPRFQVHNEEILGANPISQNELQVFAKIPGTTQINLWDTEDNQYTVDVTVIADAREVEGILVSQLPYAALKVTPINSSAVVNGYVTSADDVDLAIAIVERFYPTVVNNIRVVGVQQVLLHTRIMEVSRTKLRELGIDMSWQNGSTLIESLPSGITNPTNVFQGSDFTALIRAMRQQDLIKFLAEPTVVATHGRPARFIVGGSVPYIVPSGNGNVQVEYQEYGTSVDFLPFVIGPGRVRLEVRPEVTEPDEARSIVANDINVTAFVSRYVDTAVELQAGQTFAIAGLLQSRTESEQRMTPFFGELPVMGALFRRVRERRNDLELLITVTPELVDAMDPHQVPIGAPGLHTTNPNDKDFYWNGHIEVPTLLGGDGCSIENGLYPSAETQQLHENVMKHGADMPRGSLMDQGPKAGAERIPAGAVVPSSEPTVVGKGVTVVTPETP